MSAFLNLEEIATFGDSGHIEIVASAFRVVKYFNNLFIISFDEVIIKKWG